MATKTSDDPKPNNMDLWDRLKRTDPKATKPFKRAGGFSGAQIDPYYRYQLMTEVFGPCGKGWGYELTAPIFSDGMVFIGATVWYIDEETKEKHWSGMQYGGDVLHIVNRDGKSRANDEALKMAVTDAVGKAVSILGLGADIYMGQFDDSKYREESEKIFAAKAAGWTADTLQAFEKEIGKRVGECESLETLDALWQSEAKEKLIEIGKFDEAAKKRIVGLFSARKSAIQKAMQGDGEEEKTDPEENPAQKQMAPGDDLPKFQLTKDKDGKPRWGALTKSLKGALEQAVRENRDASEVHGFWFHHSKLIEAMRKAGGDYVGYVEKLEEQYQETIAKLEVVE